MFSVIIPLYNKAPYVEKAIRSVAAQTMKDFELIVVDDGSTDNSYEIAQKALSSSFPPLGGQGANPLGGWGAATQLNSGVSTARNNGVALANYPYICFLDADDWWAPTYLEEMKRLIDEFPDAGIYGSSYYIVKNGREHAAAIGVEPGFEKGIINYCKVYARTLIMPLWTGAVVVPKTVFEEENGFKPTLKLGEDFDLWIRIALRHKVVLLNKPLAYYNQDVEFANRGVVQDKIYEKNSFVTFNLQYLDKFESTDWDLKVLLDRLRVVSLLRYRIQGVYKTEVNELIKKIDFSNIDKIYYFAFHAPVYVVKIWYAIMKIASQLKKKFRK